MKKVTKKSRTNANLHLPRKMLRRMAVHTVRSRPRAILIGLYFSDEHISVKTSTQIKTLIETARR